jgi:acetate kinase
MALIIETLAGPDGAVDDVREVAAVGHRVVHGGEEFTQAFTAWGCFFGKLIWT